MIRFDRSITYDVNVQVTDSFNIRLSSYKFSSEAILAALEWQVEF
jgi:hypothetical protein